uniref:C2H2-type domain-containing protein n=1 Tax=Tetranychus urticae TaxID=32264 RepID=T1JZL0_TETUR
MAKGTPNVSSKKANFVINGNYLFPAEFLGRRTINGKDYIKVLIPEYYAPIHNCSLGDEEPVTMVDEAEDLPYEEEFRQESITCYKCPYCGNPFKHDYDAKKHTNSQKNKDPACKIRRKDEPMVDGEWPFAKKNSLKEL